jgi:hypothetical protein
VAAGLNDFGASLVAQSRLPYFSTNPIKRRRGWGGLDVFAIGGEISGLLKKSKSARTAFRFKKRGRSRITAVKILLVGLAMSLSSIVRLHKNCR